MLFVLLLVVVVLVLVLLTLCVCVRACILPRCVLKLWKSASARECVHAVYMQAHIMDGQCFAMFREEYLQVQSASTTISV